MEVGCRKKEGEERRGLSCGEDEGEGEGGRGLVTNAESEAGWEVTSE